MGDFARNVSIKRRKAKLFLEIAAKRALVIQSNYFKAKIDLLQMGEEAKYKVNIYFKKSLCFLSQNFHCILRFDHISNIHFHFYCCGISCGQMCFVIETLTRFLQSLLSLKRRIKRRGSRGKICHFMIDFA